MTLTEATRLLELPPDATRAQLETRYQLLRTRLEEKINTAPALYLKERHRVALANVTAAYELITLAGEVLTPGLSPSPSPEPDAVAQPASPASNPPPPAAPVAPPPAPPPPPAPTPKPAPAPVVKAIPPAPPAPPATEPARPTPAATPAPAPKPAPQRAPAPVLAAATTEVADRKPVLARVLAIIVIVLLLGGGGVWFMKHREAAAARAHIASGLQGRQTEARLRWERLEAEATAAQAGLAALKTEQETSVGLAPPASAELQARHRAQSDFVAWCAPALADSPAKALLDRIDADLAAGNLIEPPLEAERDAALDQAERMMRTRKAALLALGRPVNIVSEPAGLHYTLVDAYGRTVHGTTPASVDTPWGQTRVTFDPPSSEWAAMQRELQVAPDSAGELKAVFTLAPVKIASTPDGLAYELLHASGFSRSGLTPAALENVPTGPATVKLSRPDWPVIEQTVDIVATGPNTFAIEFAPGTLTLASEPAGATVLSGEKTLGVTPLTIDDLIPGEHTLSLQLDGYGAAVVKAQVRARESTLSSVVLKPVTVLEKGKPYRVPGLDLELMPIPAGSFTMGSPISESEHNSDETQHKVTISQPFWLGKYEVTQAEWQAVMGDDPSFFKGARLPVEQVSWETARLFCTMLTERERAADRLPAGYHYTLPTEAQWEYACRAGSPAAYAGTGILSDMGWYKVNSEGRTREVGRKQANAWGLHDMHGNVWEWCYDWFGLYPNGNATDPAGPLVGTGRVNRGGGWGSVAPSCRAAFRLNDLPGSRTRNLGFRLALVPGL